MSDPAGSNPTATEAITARTPHDYAIEFGRYMANAAEAFMAEYWFLRVLGESTRLAMAKQAVRMNIDTILSAAVAANLAFVDRVQ